MNTFTTSYVFVADDDEDDRYLLQFAFDRYCFGCQVKFTLDGLELLLALSQGPIIPQLIILDLNMPRLNGFETLQVLKHNPLYTHVPIVILTTSDRNEDRQMAYELGADGFITKPLAIEQLGQIVCQLAQDWLVDRALNQ